MILASADPQAVETQDRFAAEHLVRTAACMAVPRMREVAVAENKPLLTFTLEADVSFAAPSDIDRFTFRLAKALADIAGEFTSVENGRTYRVTIAGHPAAATRGQTPGLN